jgi:hypothetical protein
MFTSSTVPGGIPQRLSPRPGADAMAGALPYDFNGVALSNPQPVTALQVRHDGHTGGGLVVLDDDSVLVSTGDNGDAGEDGREYTQDATNHLGKILRITPLNGSAAVVAVGIRNTQRLVINPNAGDPRLEFADVRRLGRRGAQQHQSRGSAVERDARELRMGTKRRGSAGARRHLLHRPGRHRRWAMRRCPRPDSFNL